VTNIHTQTQKQTEATERPEVTDSLEAARLALDAALEKKGLEPVLLHVNELCSYTEYILLVSGRSDRQVDAISDAVSAALSDSGRTALGIEGVSSGQWALLDYGDIVIHVFHHPVREHYDLEGLWIDAPRVPIEVPAENRMTAEDRY
jgi:ribosome-associated protein